MGTGSSKSRIQGSGVSAGSSGAVGRAHSSLRSRPHSSSMSGCHLRLDMIRLSGITEQGYTYMWDSKTGQLRVWSTPAGDGLGAFLLNTAPNLPTTAASVEELAGHCRLLHAAIKGRGHPCLVELSVVQLAGGYGALRMITKTRQRASGTHAYTGAFLIPFRDAAIVIKVECEESSNHGIASALCNGANCSTEDVNTTADTDRAATDPSLSSSDSGTADEQGSGVEEGHSSKEPPLTRAQRVLADVEACLLLHPCCAALAPLAMPLLRKASPLLAGPAAAAAAAAGLFADHGGKPKQEAAVTRRSQTFGGIGGRQRRALAAMGHDIADV